MAGTFYEITSPIYQPASRIISGISNSVNAVITTAQNHLYASGTIVRLDIVPGSPMELLNQQFSPITVLTPTTFSTQLDTSEMNAYSPPTSNSVTNVSVPIGEISSILTAAVQNTLV